MELFYRISGQGRPLVILHGLFGSSDNWMSISKALQNDYSVFTVDQRHHGRSPNEGDFNYDTLSEDLHDFLTRENIENPILVGHSMGGKTVMQYAVRYPDTFEKLVVVDIAPRAYPVHHGAILEGLNSISLDGIRSRGEADKALSVYVDHPTVRQFLLKNLYRKQDKSFDWRINLPAITENIEIIGTDIKFDEPCLKPTLFIRGPKSDYIADEDMKLAKEIFPQAKLTDIEGAGHWVHAEKPKEFVSVLREFIEK